VGRCFDGAISTRGLGAKEPVERDERRGDEQQQPQRGPRMATVLTWRSRQWRSGSFQQPMEMRGMGVLE
jgi:hypothetical protein